jgi:hypothetical protein
MGCARAPSRHPAVVILLAPTTASCRAPDQLPPPHTFNTISTHQPLRAFIAHFPFPVTVTVYSHDEDGHPARCGRRRRQCRWRSQDEAQQGPSFRAACKSPSPPQRDGRAGRTSSKSCQKYANIQEHGKALGQKYMGIKPESHMDHVFKAPYVGDGLHPVPISNYLNAQCTSQL